METSKKESLSHPMGLESKKRGKRRKKTKNPIPYSMRGNPEINHPKLTKGQKKFLGSVCTVYSTENMKKNIEEQYVRQLLYEKDRGIIKNVDWYKYLDYFCQSSRRKHLFQPPKSLRSTTSNRARSSFPGPKPTLAPLPPIPRAVTHHISRTKRSSLEKNEASHRYVTTIRRDESIPDVSTSNDITNRNSITVIDDDGGKDGEEAETKQDSDDKASVDDSDDDDDTESDDDDMEGSTFTLTTADKGAPGSTANMSDPTTQQQSLDKDEDDDQGSTSVAAAPELTRDDGEEAGDADDVEAEGEEAGASGEVEFDDSSSQVEGETAQEDDDEQRATKEEDDDKKEDAKEAEETKDERNEEEEKDIKEEEDAKEEVGAKEEKDDKEEEDAEEEFDAKQEKDDKKEEIMEEVEVKQEKEEEAEEALSSPTLSKSDEKVETNSKTSEIPVAEEVEPTADEEVAAERSDDEGASSDVVSVSPLGEPTTNLLTLLEQPVNQSSSSSSSQIEGVTRPRSRIGNRPSSTSSSPREQA